MAHRLAELQPQHHAAIRMRIEGRSTDEICEALEIVPRTLYIWFSDPLVKVELNHQLQSVNEIFAEKLAETAVRGLTALTDVATMPVDEPLDWKTKLDAIRLVVERTIPPGVFPDPEVPIDPTKALWIEAIRKLSWEQLDQLADVMEERVQETATNAPDRPAIPVSSSS